MISVVVPVYRNEGTLRELAARLSEAMEDRPYELIFVVDASPDDSAVVAGALAAADERVKVLELARNVGQNRAILAGMAAASGEICVWMDGDLQDPPQAVPVMVDELRRRSDLRAVFGRRLPGSGARGLRVWTSRLFKWTLWLASGLRLSTHVGQFAAVRRDVATQMAAWRDRQVHTLALLSRIVGREELSLVAVARQEPRASTYSGAMRLRLACQSFRTLAGIPAAAESPLERRRTVGLGAEPPVVNLALTPLGQRMADARLWLSLAAAALAALVLRLFLAMVVGWNPADEAWMLQVIRRVAAGEVLYRDLFFGVLPLAVWIGWGWCAVFGFHLLAMKGLVALVNVMTFVGTHRLLKGLGKSVSRWPLALWMVLIPLPMLSSFYGHLATCMAVWSGVALLRWRDRPTLCRAASMGLCLGLAVAAKYSTGALVALACAAVMLATRRTPPRRAAALPRRAGHVMAAALTALALVGATVLPLVWAGAWGDLVACNFAVKSSYLELAPLSFWEQFARLSHVMNLPEFRATYQVASHLSFPLALLAGTGLTALLVRGRRARHIWPILPVLVALFIAAFPRADAEHLSQAFPAILVALFLAGDGLTSWMRRAFAWTGVFVAGGLLAMLLTGGVHRLRSDRFTFTGLPHMGGTLVSVAEARRLETLVQAIHHQPQPVFILSTEASGLYLISGTPNVTRFDYPLANEFQPGMQEQLAEEIIAGRVATVLLDRGYGGPLVPGELKRRLIEGTQVDSTVDRYEIRRPPGRGMLPAAR